jgi:hypothetical protein
VKQEPSQVTAGIPVLQGGEDVNFRNLNTGEELTESYGGSAGLEWTSHYGEDGT